MKDLKDLLNEQNVSQELNKIRHQLLNDRRFLNYLKEKNIQLTDALIDNSLMNLLTFNDYYFRCEGCKGLHECKQEMTGYRPELELQGDHIHLVYRPCRYQVEHEKNLAVASRIRAFYLPKNILNARIESIELAKDGTSSRNQAINQVFSFASSYDGKTYRKGVYLYGPFGVGKTYILAAMANELAKKGIEVGLVYVPDLIRELKGAIGSNNLENIMNEIKSRQVLILDDIGSEMLTAWVRDEIIGPLLQHRLLEELPTFFTSNRSLEELIKDYSRTTDGNIDTLKANRIGDRIKGLSIEQFVDGKNYRY